MRLTPQEPAIPEVGGFTAENDIFGYRDFGDRLANLVQNIDEPLVITLDGPWGSGKSVFTKQWEGLLRERGAAVIHFDAFGNDHYEDAFLALSAEILVAATDPHSGDKGAARKYLNKAKKVGALLTPIATRVAARVATAGILSLEDVEAGGEAIKAAAKALGDEAGKAVENVISESLSKASDERAALEVFREALSEVAAALAEKKADNEASFPLIFVVDELDRCRPPFALSIIERIKHLFSVPGVCFVLVTNLSQLEQSVQGAYGTTFDAKTYLEKFYQVRVTLPEGLGQSAKHRSAYVAHLWSALGVNFSDGQQNSLVKEDVAMLVEAHGVSLRKIERIMTHVALACMSIGPRNMLIAPILAGLCVMRLTHKELYEAALSKAIVWGEMEKFLQPNKGQGVQDDLTLNWWRFAAGADMTQEEINSYANTLARYHVRDRRDVIPFTATFIEELIQQVHLPGDQ